jgi:Beta-galactosidase
MSRLEFKFKPAAQPLTDAWQQLPVAPRRGTRLGISFRPLQAAAFGLDERAALGALLAYPFELIRLGAYWDRIEPEPGAFETEALDRQIEAAEQAGKQIIVCVGPLKTFGYPEFFVPAHRLPQPFPEHTLIQPSAYPALLEAATGFIARLVGRYRAHASIVAWQLEHEAVDPLGVAHSWRLAAAWIEQEVQALRQADPGRPVMMNGFLPTTWPVRLSQGWSTRDQGDSLAVAQRLADMVGIDYYPRNALAAIGDRTLYLDGGQSRWQQERRAQLLAWAGAHGKKLLISEGQAEPWETKTTPPNPAGRAMSSCLPEHLIGNYNDCAAEGPAGALYAYLFWGAEYWLLRQQGGDASYLKAFARLLEQAG